MRSGWSRRAFLGATGAAALTLAACGKGADGRSGGVTVEHLYGTTTIPAPPTRVVSAGFTEQDSVLALGVVPIATTEWWGEEPSAVWPWARSALGAATPTVLSLADGIAVEQIASLEPDLILAIDAGCDSDTYATLSAIAPTVAQSGYAPFGEPWRDQANAIGTACFQADAMAALITAAEDKLSAVATDHPGFGDKSALLLQGRVVDDAVIATTAGAQTDFLTRMGFSIPDGIAGFTRDHQPRAYLPLDQLGPVLDGADVLIWTTETDDDAARLLADPHIAALRATAGNRHVFTGKELAGAIGFGSVLSYPLVADRLPALLTRALGS